MPLWSMLILLIAKIVIKSRKPMFLFDFFVKNNVFY